MKVRAFWIVSVAGTLLPAAGARNAPVPIVTEPAMMPLPPSVPAVMLTGPVPVADPLRLATRSVPHSIVVPPA